MARTSTKNLLTYAKKVIDSLINEEELWVRNEENLDEKKPPWLDTSVIADVLVVKARAGVGVSDRQIDTLSDWLDTLGLNDVDSFNDGDILWLRIDMIGWDAANMRVRSALGFQQKGESLSIAGILSRIDGRCWNNYFQFSKKFTFEVFLSDWHAYLHDI